jgi:hypothetical protein
MRGFLTFKEVARILRRIAVNQDMAVFAQEHQVRGRVRIVRPEVVDPARSIFFKCNDVGDVGEQSGLMGYGMFEYEFIATIEFTPPRSPRSQCDARICPDVSSDLDW